MNAPSPSQAATGVGVSPIQSASAQGGSAAAHGQGTGHFSFQRGFLQQDGAELCAWHPLCCPHHPVSPQCRGGMPVFVGKEMLDSDGAKGGFFPQAEKIQHGAGKHGSSLVRGAPCCYETTSGVKHPTWGCPACADPLKDPTGTGTGLWRACCTPGCPAPAPSASCPLHPPGSQGLACASRSTNTHLVSVKKAQRSQKPRMQLGV